jgi:hypothetical protein
MGWSDDVTLTVELGFGSGPLADSPTWTDITSDVRGLSISRGRSSVRSSFDAGSCTITVSNLDGEYDPANTAATNYPNLKLGTPVRMQAVHNLTTYDLFRGHVSAWPLDYPSSGKDAVVTLEASENLALLNTTLLSESYAEENTDDRIAAVLTDAGWPAADRDLDAGTSPVAAVVYEGSALGQILAAVAAEQGVFFIAKDGDATFLNRVAFSTATSQATFDPGTDLDYSTVRLAYDYDFLINHAVVTAGNDESGEASDATSIADHGEFSHEETVDLLLGEAYALNVAEWIVGKNKDMAVRVVGFTISPQEDPTDLWPEVLDRELLDLVTVKVSTPGAGDDLNQLVAVESVQHEITPGFWQTTYSCHPLSVLEQTDFWILGTSELGTETILA